MYAIIKTSGKQYKAEKGTVLTLDRQKGEAGDTITLDDEQIRLTVVKTSATKIELVKLSNLPSEE